MAGPESVVLDDPVEVAIAVQLMTALAETDLVRPGPGNVGESSKLSDGPHLGPGWEPSVQRSPW